MTWHLTDLLLWQAVAQGVGLATVAEPLVAYCGAYLEAMRSRQTTAQSYLTSVNAVPGVYEWPLASGRYYYGVECTLTADELLTS